jgi:low affinity Fe/Cu permease
MEMLKLVVMTVLIVLWTEFGRVCPKELAKLPCEA